MAYNKQTWVPYDENKTEEQNIQAGAVGTSERMNFMETGIEVAGTHVDNRSNPHNVTKAQVGLSNVSNEAQAPKVEFDSHVANKTNPHGVTKSQIGLPNVTNDQQATKVNFDNHVANKTNPHGVTTAQIGAVTKTDFDNFARKEATPTERGLMSADDKKKLDAYGGSETDWKAADIITGNQVSEGNTPQFKKTRNLDGTYSVEMTGQVEKTQGNYSTAAFAAINLPVGYRPSKNVLLQVADNTFRGARIAILPNGNIQVNTASDSKYVVLDTVLFRI